MIKPRPSLFLQFFGPQLLVLLLSLGAVVGYAWHAGWIVQRDERLRAMYLQADLVARLAIDEAGGIRSAADVQALWQTVRAEPGLRITIVHPDGRVLADSDADAAAMASHADRPEIVAALATGRGWSERYSATLHCRLLYAARAIQRGGRTVAVVRVAARRDALAADFSRAHNSPLLLIALTCLAAALLSYLLARQVVRAVSDMRAGVARIGGGVLEHRLALPPLPPLADLASAINQTAARLQEQILALARERSLRERILSGMSEGVVALDSRRQIVSVNDAARRLLALPAGDIAGTPIHLHVRHPDFLLLADAAGATESRIERELEGDNALWASAAPLRDPDGRRTGTLIVISDLSRVRRLERIRQEFVQNVSHELRTPITSIIGFVETLQDGAWQEPATAERFLKIIRRQAGQLQSIVTDLLALSRLESQNGTLAREWTPLADIIANAVEVCQARAQARQVEVQTMVPAGLQVHAHAGLLEQAVMNLVDNAIQYGGGKVDVVAEAGAKSGVHIRVLDQGPGISPEHIDRLFERFYRIDKGRSREAGGTGLGLAIVKHIALLHGGTATVSSALGKGSVFTIWLPETTGLPAAQPRGGKA